MRPTRRFHRTLSLGRLSLAVGWELYREPSWDLYVRLRLCFIPSGTQPDMPCEDCEQGLSTCCIPPGRTDV